MYFTLILFCASLGFAQGIIGGEDVIDFTTYGYMAQVHVFAPETLRYRGLCAGTVVHGKQTRYFDSK